MRGAPPAYVARANGAAADPAQPPTIGDVDGSGDGGSLAWLDELDFGDQIDFQPGDDMLDGLIELRPPEVLTPRRANASAWTTAMSP